MKPIHTLGPQKTSKWIWTFQYSLSYKVFKNQIYFVIQLFKSTDFPLFFEEIVFFIDLTSSIFHVIVALRKAFLLIGLECS